MQKFADSFEELLDGVRAKRESSLRRDSERTELIDRIWERDPTVWTGGDEAKWLGWLDEPRRMGERAGELQAFADGVAEEGSMRSCCSGWAGRASRPR